MGLDELNKLYLRQMNRDGQEQQAFVLGEGKQDNPLLMLVGEAPGEQEVLLRRPFVGKAGKNLDAFLEVIGVERNNIYITNTVKLRPTKTSKKGRISNRPPTRKEQEAFIPWLMAEVHCVAPRILVTLGNTPLRSLLGKDISIGDCHGKAIRYKIGLDIFPLYHPAAVIYNRTLMDTYQEDLRSLKSIVSELA